MHFSSYVCAWFVWFSFCTHTCPNTFSKLSHIGYLSCEFQFHRFLLFLTPHFTSLMLSPLYYSPLLRLFPFFVIHCLDIFFLFFFNTASASVFSLLLAVHPFSNFIASSLLPTPSIFLPLFVSCHPCLIFSFLISLIQSFPCSKGDYIITFYFSSVSTNFSPHPYTFFFHSLL